MQGTWLPTSVVELDFCCSWRGLPFRAWAEFCKAGSCDWGKACGPNATSFSPTNCIERSRPARHCCLRTCHGLFRSLAMRLFGFHLHGAARLAARAAWFYCAGSLRKAAASPHFRPPFFPRLSSVGRQHGRPSLYRFLLLCKRRLFSGCVSGQRTVRKVVCNMYELLFFWAWFCSSAAYLTYDNTPPCHAGGGGVSW